MSRFSEEITQQEVERLSARIERLTNELQDARAEIRHEEISHTITIDQRDRARAALQEIVKGEGRFSTDRLTHAHNTIEDMISLATEALANKQEADDE